MSRTTDNVSIHDRIRIWPPIGEIELLVLQRLVKGRRPGIAIITQLRPPGLSKARFQRALIQLTRRGYIQHTNEQFTRLAIREGFVVTLKGLVYAMAQCDGLWHVFDEVLLLHRTSCSPILAKWKELSVASSGSARLLVAEATRFGFEDWNSLEEHFIQELVKSLGVSETDKRRLFEVIFRDSQAREHFLAVLAELERRHVITDAETSKIQQLFRSLMPDT